MHKLRDSKRARPAGRRKSGWTVKGCLRRIKHLWLLWRFLKWLWDSDLTPFYHFRIAVGAARP